MLSVLGADTVEREIRTLEAEHHDWCEFRAGLPVTDGRQYGEVSDELQRIAAEINYRRKALGR